MEAREEKHQNGTKLTYRQLLKQWSKQTTQKLPNKGPQTVFNSYNNPHKLNGTENCEISEKLRKSMSSLSCFFKQTGPKVNNSMASFAPIFITYFTTKANYP